jgi:hypothetical protein
MTTFVNAVRNQEARTANGMKARASTTNACVDLFFKIGASRGRNIVPDFTAAYVQDRDIASRIALWVRDARGGAGERKLFRDILLELAKTDIDRCIAMINKVPELGRWDDLLIFEKDSVAELHAFTLIKDALESGVNAKYLLNQIDIMSEEECQKILDTYNDRNGASS